MQQVTIQPPTTPGGPSIATSVPTGVPQTRAEFNALMNKRGELSDQLVSASSRRKSLADELQATNPSVRAGIEARLKVLDDRIVSLENEIARTGELIANAPLHVSTRQTAEVSQAVDRVTQELVPIVGMLSVFVFLPLAIAFARLIWKRASAPTQPALADYSTQQRLEQMQQAIDSIAIEVERISEGQRFVTKMIGDRSAVPLERG